MIRKTALQNHNLWSFRLLLWLRWWRSEVKTQTGTRSNRRPKMAKKSWVTTTRPALRHWCQVSIIRGCGMVLNLTGRNWFTTAGRVWSDSGWPWKFRRAGVTLDDCKMAPLTSQKLARAIFFSASVWPSSSSNFDIGPLPSDSMKKKSIRSELMILEWSFPSRMSNQRVHRFKDKIIDGMLPENKCSYFFPLSSFHSRQAQGVLGVVLVAVRAPVRAYQKLILGRSSESRQVLAVFVGGAPRQALVERCAAERW